MKKKKDPTIFLPEEELQKQLKRKNPALERLKREWEIEASLEKVRAGTMAMQKSEKLQEVANTIYECLKELQVLTDFANLISFIEDSKDYYVWVSHLPKPIRIPFNDFTEVQRIYNDVMERRDELFTHTFSGEIKNEYYQFLLEQTDLGKNLPGVQKKKLLDSEFNTTSLVFTKNTGIQLVRLSDKAFSKEENEILKRFVNVFQQAYTRFLDLQKAEAQAREAQIQLALERVRAGTMAMQKSEELGEILFELVKQVQSLGVATSHCAFNIYDEDQNSSTEWASNAGGSYSSYKTRGVSIFRRYYEIGQTGETLHVEVIGEDKSADHYAFLCTLPGVGEQLVKLRKSGISFPTSQIDNVAYFKYGYLLFITYEPVPGAHDIFKRFAKVFELAYTRFLDLQKAEEQVREAKIEAALERVRSRSLAMHKSDELQEVVNIVFEKLNELNVELYTAIIFIFTEGSKDIVWWLANKANQQYARILVPYADNQYLKDIFEAKEKGKDFFSATYSFEEKNDLFHHLFENTDFKYAPEKQKQFLFGSELANMSVALAKKTGINITSYTRKTFSEKENEILKRFAKVFDQSYTRFLDLQKAEAQAREAQIEAALEKVRSRTMAMHKSEELIEVIASVFQQLEQLSFRIDSANLFLNYKEHPFKFWMAVPGHLYPSEIDVPYGDFALMNRFIREIKSNATLVTAKFNQEEKNEWVRHLIQHTTVGNSSDEKKKHMFMAPGLAMSVVGVKNIALAITNYSVQSYSDEENEILRRFINVFDQTYTRFLDLQKAEAQAREAQIEAALERVRSRTTSMQKSEELREVIQIVFEQLRHLDFNIDSAHFNLNYKESDDYNLWSAAPGQPYPVKTFIPYFDHPVFITARQAKKNDLAFFTESYTQDEKNKFFEHIFEHTPVIPEERRKYILSCRGVAASTVLMNTISLWIMNYAGIPYSEAENAILKRFGKIFEQAHTRFLDLQKAEAQAREAQIEAALERVRSRSMGMQKSEELKEVIKIIYEQFAHLNIKIEHTGFVIDYKVRDDYVIWEAGPLGFRSQVRVPHFDSVYLNRFNEAKEQGIDFFATNLTFEEKNRFYEKFFEYVPGLPEEAKKLYFSCPGLAISTVLLENVCLYIENFLGIPYSDEENAALIRFGKVFQQTYTRFLDLQKAETQAKEAVKRASVDRVRAEIASMRTTSDLERITPLVWNELTTLGVPFIRCGVFIMDEEQQQVQSFLSTPDGKAIAAFHQKYNTPGEIARIIEHWHKKKMYKQHWNEAQFIEFTKNLVEQGAITSGEKYLTENRPTDLYLHFLPFLQGMLYAGSTTALGDDELQLVQNLADAFSTAYARYEDFNKLESANIKIEKTLVDLKQTQAQLVQSEKMASLGELTAGIAHEIQNPLNFVNNFSELNKELLAELNEEIEKGNYDEVKIIAKDVAGNEEKISHHGKRADAIVKGMLQHSRSSSATKEPTDINKLADEYLRLAYHGLRAKDKSFNATMKTDYDESIGNISIIPQEIGRVLLNLYNNAFYAVNEKMKNAGENYKPTVSVETKRLNNKLEIWVTDNGNGIPQIALDKIFQPFFTTKPTGQGTGLGLSLAYDIIKAHGGELKVVTKEGEESEFIVSLSIV